MMFFFPSCAYRGDQAPNIEMGGEGAGSAGRILDTLKWFSRYFRPGMDPFGPNKKHETIGADGDMVRSTMWGDCCKEKHTMHWVSFVDVGSAVFLILFSGPGAALTQQH